MQDKIVNIENISFLVKGKSLLTADLVKKSFKNNILVLKLNADIDAKSEKEPFFIEFQLKLKGMFTSWNPDSGFIRGLYPNWLGLTNKSRSTVSAPVQTVMSQNSKNILTVSVADALNPVTISSGVHEETADMFYRIGFMTENTNVCDIGKTYETDITLDFRDIDFQLTVADAVSFIKPCDIYDWFSDAVYSTWYSYHQTINAADIIAECKIAKEYGIKTVILDDGWQTDDTNRGYRFCGDWLPTKNKFPDMADFVKKLHALGIRVMVWYSVPYVGEGADIYSRFKDKVLEKVGDDFYVLDIRYKDVRDYLVDLYLKAVDDYDIDGLKLDFIDCFGKVKDIKPVSSPLQDIESIDVATDVLLKQLTTKIRAKKPDFAFEFRQDYIGPVMKQYGNMLRVSDCPMDALVNRVRGINLRLVAGKTPVHADMLMWDYAETAQNAAKQIINILFFVPQISVRIDKLSKSHKAMLKFFIDFYSAHKDVLINGEFMPRHTESNYSAVSAHKDGKNITVSYNENYFDLKFEGLNIQKAFFVNGTDTDFMIFESEKVIGYKITDCEGKIVSEGKLNKGLNKLSVPVSGVVEF